MVDDELAACKLLSIMLSPSEYRCAMACNGEEALVILQRPAIRCGHLRPADARDERHGETRVLEPLENPFGAKVLPMS